MSKRGVDDISDWMGWPRFLGIYGKYRDAPYPMTSRAAFLTVFNSGCRASEAITIRKDQCVWNEEAIVIQKVPVLKKDKKTFRNAVIKLDHHNPLAQEFLNLIENCEGEYLFPKHTGFLRYHNKTEPSTRMTLWRRINDVDNLFPHSLRAYRAMMLVYERGFTVQDLVEWFDWSGADMAVHYTRTRDISNKMGIKESPI